MTTVSEHYYTSAPFRPSLYLTFGGDGPRKSDVDDGRSDDKDRERKKRDAALPQSPRFPPAS